VHEPVFFVRLFFLLLAPISLAVGRWVPLSYASSHFPSCCVGTLARLAGDGRGCSLEENFCRTKNRCPILCSPPIFVLWSGLPLALGGGLMWVCFSCVSTGWCCHTVRRFVLFLVHVFLSLLSPCRHLRSKDSWWVMLKFVKLT